MDQILLQLQDPTIISALLAVLALVGGGTFYAKTRRRSEDQAPPAAPPAVPGVEEEPPAATEDAAGAGKDEAEAVEPAAAAPTAGPTVAPDEEAVPEAPAVEVPEPVAGRLQRLRARLARSGSFGGAVLSVLGRGSLSEEDWEEIEETLLVADLGISATEELMEHLRTEAKVLGAQANSENMTAVLRAELLKLVDPDLDRSLRVAGGLAEDGSKQPGVVLVVGVNGTGKTTTVGKLARVLVAEGQTVLLGAADTFRAAAVEQLSTWGQRVGVDVVSTDREGADPASVAFDAVREGVERGVDVVLVDTAGRLQNKADLMDELGKVRRVMEKRAPLTETLLVLDATTGQNGMRQAQVFAEVVPLTGIVLTKLDGSAKGGIVVSVQRELGVPVKLVGLGEGPDDLAPFDAETFVDALLA